MEEEIIIKCNSYSQSMFKIAEIGGTKEIIEWVSVGNDMSAIRVVGRRQLIHYQCPEYKDVKVY